MKILFTIAIGVLGLSSLNAQTLKVPVKSPLCTIKQAVALSEISIDYSRPNKNGRTIFGELVPYNTLWRTGANAPTKITFGEDILLENKEVKAGTYSLFTIPGETEWTLILNKNLQMWGTDGYDEKEDILRLQLPVKKVSEITESFTIQFTDVKPTTCNLELVWENVKVSAKISIVIDDKVMKNIESVMTQDKRPYHQAAQYYYDNKKDLNKALEWATKAFELNPKAYWSSLLKSKIQLDLKDKKGAISSAEITKKLAEEDKDSGYVKQADEIIEKAKK
ncbi:MAG: DUF2911 domain-containing protein [Flavobacteriia bacterium]|nr:DUF2911 domain-containing protein [Flavobacteriia bacterium]